MSQQQAFFCWKCKHHFSSLATVPKSLGINQITTSTFLQSQEKPPTKEALAFCIYRGAYKNTCVLSYIIHRKVLNLHIKKYCNCDCVPTCKEAKNKKRESMMSRAKCIGGKLMMIFQIGSSCFAYFLSESKMTMTQWLILSDDDKNHRVSVLTQNAKFFWQLLLCASIILRKNIIRAWHQKVIKVVVTSSKKHSEYSSRQLCSERKSMNSFLLYLQRRAARRGGDEVVFISE